MDHICRFVCSSTVNKRIRLVSWPIRARKPVRYRFTNIHERWQWSPDLVLTGMSSYRMLSGKDVDWPDFPLHKFFRVRFLSTTLHQRTNLLTDFTTTLKSLKSVAKSCSCVANYSMIISVQRVLLQYILHIFNISLLYKNSKSKNLTTVSKKIIRTS